MAYCLVNNMFGLPWHCGSCAMTKHFVNFEIGNQSFASAKKYKNHRKQNQPQPILSSFFLYPALTPPLSPRRRWTRRIMRRWRSPAVAGVSTLGSWHWSPTSPALHQRMLWERSSAWVRPLHTSTHICVCVSVYFKGPGLWMGVHQCDRERYFLLVSLNLLTADYWLVSVLDEYLSFTVSQYLMQRCFPQTNRCLRDALSLIVIVISLMTSKCTHI